MANNSKKFDDAMYTLSHPEKKPRHQKVQGKDDNVGKILIIGFIIFMIVCKVLGD